MSLSATAGIALETERLTLCPATSDDVAPLHTLWTEPDVRRHLWDDQIITVAQASEAVVRSVDDWRRRRYGLWTIRPAADRPLIGFCGFRASDWRDAPELLFGLTVAVWGRGYASEAATAALGYVFETLGVNEVVAATDGANCASIRLLDRLMTFERRGTLHGLDTLFYHARREPAGGRRVPGCPDHARLKNSGRGWSPTASG